MVDLVSPPVKKRRRKTHIDRSGSQSLLQKLTKESSEDFDLIEDREDDLNKLIDRIRDSLIHEDFDLDEDLEKDKTTDETELDKPNDVENPRQ